MLYNNTVNLELKGSFEPSSKYNKQKLHDKDQQELASKFNTVTNVQYILEEEGMLGIATK